MMLNGNGVKLYPLIRLDDKSTWEILNCAQVETVVVRLQDLVSKSTFKFNSIFKKVKKSGGVHKFLSFYGNVILSFIMRDEIIYHFHNKRYNKYQEVIEALKPDYYTTIDGWTYERIGSKSYFEIDRCFEESSALIEKCSIGKPIGLVKGSSISQIEYHKSLLESIGIRDFILHMGDFSRYGDSKMMWTARHYAQKIKSRSNSLILYGMGSPKKMIRFSFVDAFVTFNHFITANYGMKYVGGRKVKCKLEDNRKNVIISNFLDLSTFAHNMNFFQQKLDIGGDWSWEEALADPVVIPENM